MNKASGHTLADAVRGAPPETHSSEGGGVWAEYLPKAALMSNDLFLDDVNVLVPVWLGGRGDRPGFPIGRNRIFREVPIHRAVRGGMRAARSEKREMGARGGQKLRRTPHIHDTHDTHKQRASRAGEQ